MTEWKANALWYIIKKQYDVLFFCLRYIVTMSVRILGVWSSSKWQKTKVGRAHVPQKANEEEYLPNWRWYQRLTSNMWHYSGTSCYSPFILKLIFRWSPGCTFTDFYRRLMQSRVASVWFCINLTSHFFLLVIFCRRNGETEQQADPRSDGRSGEEHRV